MPLARWETDRAPDPEVWLGHSRPDRIAALRRAHEGRVPDALHPEGTELGMHCALHAAIEDQIASGDPPEVAACLARLEGDGLRRHPALHLAMHALAAHLARAATIGLDPADYASRLAAVTASLPFPRAPAPPDPPPGATGTAGGGSTRRPRG